MATNAISVVNDARYDLKDYGTGVNIENAELLNYLNRVIGIFGRELCRFNSDYTHASASSSTSGSLAYIAAPTDAHHIRTVWVGKTLATVNQVPQISPAAMEIKERDHYALDSSSNQTTGTPLYWALRGANIVFQQPIGQYSSSSVSTDYKYKVYYNQIPTAFTALQSSSSGTSIVYMPWAGKFDAHITQALVFYARAKKDDTMEQPDAAVGTMAKETAIGEVVSRNFIRKGYRLNF